MLHGIQEGDNMHWHPPLIRQHTNVWLEEENFPKTTFRYTVPYFVKKILCSHWFCKPPLIWDSVLRYLLSLKVGCHSISDNLFCLWYRTWHYYRIRLFTQMRKFSIEHLQRMRHSKRGRLRFWTPCPVPLLDLHTFLCRDQSLLKLSCSRLLSFEHPSVPLFYFSELLFPPHVYFSYAGNYELS